MSWLSALGVTTRVSYALVKAGHLLIDGATVASGIGKKLSIFSALQNVDDGP